MNRRALAGIFLLGLIAVSGAAGAVARPGGQITVVPGTTTIIADGQAFEVTTNVSITLQLGFTSSALIEGEVAVPESAPAQVSIVWSSTGLTVFSGTVVIRAPIRFPVPPEFQAADDTGHTEK